MNVIRYFRSKWALAALILLGLVYFEGQVNQKEMNREIATESSEQSKN